MNYDMLPLAVSGVEICLCELSCAGSHQNFQTVVGLFSNVIFHFPSHLGSNLPAVGIDSQTVSSTLNVHGRAL